MVDEGMDPIGRLILVGAGPGNPDLLTVGGARALRKADVVLYDELTSGELLSMVSEICLCINVGKRGHEEPRLTQDEINELAISHVRSGQTVVRLKGGDPFVFGRGGEEASACAKAGVPFEIMPGVSSALAAPAYAGIPLTDRRYSASFAVVTGHKDPGGAAEATRWRELGKAVDTLVILMGMRSLPGLLEKLIEGGKNPDTPAAVVMNGTLPEQRVVVGTLSSLAEDVKAAGLGAPAAVVVGAVVDLRESLGWWEKQPLFGFRVLVTRGLEQAEEMAVALRSLGAVPVIRPMIELRPPTDAEQRREIEDALSSLSDYDDVVFCSTNAVRFFMQSMQAAGRVDDFLRGDARILCMGPRTAAAAREAGLAVHMSARAGLGDAQGLLEEILAAMPVTGRRILIPQSDIARQVLSAGLKAAGAHVDAPVFYLNVQPFVDVDALRADILSGQLPVLTFSSPSAVSHFAALMDEETHEACERCIIAAIGQTTARALKDVGLSPDVVPENPSVSGMASALAQHVGQPGREAAIHVGLEEEKK
ncbi:MAG: uroporphyrinogen-III C-methyltransferase [Myxococcota bacterium]|nr:uroporphyrinogen-III C-methyltransferase [Myxococcota bacterium]